MTALSPAAVEAIKAAALRQGDTRVLMMRHQLAAHDIVRKLGPVDWAFLLWSRRGGKTWFCVEQIFLDAKTLPPRSTIRYACPSKVHARDFVLPTFELVGEMLPPEHRPRFDMMRSTYFFPNGTRVVIGSCETRRDCEVQKGTSCHRAYVEEAGVIDPTLLEYVITGVLEPQFATTRGNGIIVGTPPEFDEPEHPFWARYDRAVVEGFAHKVTLDELDHVDEDIKAKLIEKAGGRDNVRCCREYYVERKSENDLTIVPEWSKLQGKCIEDREIAPYRMWYCVGDLGFNDLTVLLWAWYDFKRAQIVVKYELACDGESGLDVGFKAKNLEAEHGIAPKPYRYADAPPQMLADLAGTSPGPGLSFAPVVKDDFDAAVNQLRMLIQRERIVVDPSCTVLLSHLEHGTWNERRTDFSRRVGFGHWDAIAALLYLTRVVDWNANPYPAIEPGVTNATHFIPPELRAEHERRQQRTRNAFL